MKVGWSRVRKPMLRARTDLPQAKLGKPFPSLESTARGVPTVVVGGRSGDFVFLRHSCDVTVRMSTRVGCTTPPTSS